MKKLLILIESTLLSAIACAGTATVESNPIRLHTAYGTGGISVAESNEIILRTETPILAWSCSNSGEINRNPAGINATNNTANGTSEYDLMTSVSLAGQPDAEWQVTGWSGTGMTGHATPVDVHWCVWSVSEECLLNDVPVVLTLHGRWGNAGPPNRTTVDLSGNSVEITVKRSYAPGTVFGQTLSEWDLDCTVGRLAPGAYTVRLKLEDLDGTAIHDFTDAGDFSIIDPHANPVALTMNRSRTVVLETFRFHPADINTDRRLTLLEMNTYRSYWKRGDSWPQEPNPIPESYVIKAAELWRTGEVYQCKSSNAPDCWEAIE